MLAHNMMMVSGGNLDIGLFIQDIVTASNVNLYSYDKDGNQISSVNKSTYLGILYSPKSDKPKLYGIKGTAKTFSSFTKDGLVETVIKDTGSDAFSTAQIAISEEQNYFISVLTSEIVKFDLTTGSVLASVGGGYMYPVNLCGNNPLNNEFFLNVTIGSTANRNIRNTSDLSINRIGYLYKPVGFTSSRLILGSSGGDNYLYSVNNVGDFATYYLDSGTTNKYPMNSAILLQGNIIYTLSYNPTTRTIYVDEIDAITMTLITSNALDVLVSTEFVDHSYGAWLTSFGECGMSVLDGTLYIIMKVYTSSGSTNKAVLYKFDVTSKLKTHESILRTGLIAHQMVITSTHA